MARQMKRPKPQPTTNGVPTPTSRPDLREHLLADFATLKVPLTADSARRPAGPCRAWRPVAPGVRALR